MKMVISRAPRSFGEMNLQDSLLFQFWQKKTEIGRLLCRHFHVSFRVRSLIWDEWLEEEEVIPCSFPNKDETLATG